ncbi:MAG TPA: hypothetical protein VLB50_12955 [Ignavibacteriaceae bacterium]|nr:hypothetical protein [Ignavibacteriaceae bacterium]
MQKILLLSIILIIIFSSCNLFRKSDYDIILSTEKIEKIIAGKDTTESSLSIFHDKDLPPAGRANHIEIDTININGKNFYTVLAEYPNPLYNRFAIINDKADVLLIDKSLNGYITNSILKVGNLQFIKVEENFISKETLRLKRISFYSLNDLDEANLVFRTYTELQKTGNTYLQKIIKFTPEEIITEIQSTEKSISDLTGDSDRFVFDEKTNKFISVDNNFDTFVIDLITDFKSKTINPVINEQNDLAQQKEEIKPDEHEPGKFSLPISEQWDEIKNVKVSHLMKKLVTGTKYINNQFGAEITVIQLPDNDSSENYIDYNLENVSTGNYKVRFSEKILDGIYYYQFFEYSCTNEKFLLILKTLKSTYETYRFEYQNLINSFSMGC